MTTPMTAAEYRAITKGICDVDPIRRTLAALEEREALLGRVAELEGTIRSWQPSTDASLGALVRRIREHPMAIDPVIVVKMGWNGTGLGQFELTECLRYLDSLLRKEPEVAPSGWRYERVTDSTHYWRIAESGLSFSSATATCIPPIDREYVEKMMEASRGE